MGPPSTGRVVLASNTQSTQLLGATPSGGDPFSPPLCDASSITRPGPRGNDRRKRWGCHGRPVTGRGRGRTGCYDMCSLHIRMNLAVLFHVIGRPVRAIPIGLPRQANSPRSELPKFEDTLPSVHAAEEAGTCLVAHATEPSGENPTFSTSSATPGASRNLARGATTGVSDGGCHGRLATMSPAGSLMPY